MPFAPSNDLPPSPDVRIFFVGQLILQPLASARGCEVFINRSAADHYLSIEVRKKKQNKPDEIVMRHQGPLPFAGVPQGTQPQFGMFIRILPLSTPLVQAYNGVNDSTEGEELNLALNMQGIHDVPVGAVESVGGRPSILVEQGIFYTADTYPAGSRLRKKKPGSLPKPLAKFAGVIGANIYLTGQQRAAMIWRPDGRDVLLPFEKVDNQTYEVYVSNEPLFQDDDPQSPFLHDEFAEFYKILRDVPTDEQFTLETPPPTRGSLRTPCMSVLLNT